MLAAWLKDHYSLVWKTVFLLCAVPGLQLLWDFIRSDLGANPLATLIHTTGRSALILLALTLTVTPLRRWLSNLYRWTHRKYGKRLSDWNWLIRLRRQLGLWCFFYACAHAWLYIHLDLGYDGHAARADFQEKPYIAAGAVALIFLWPLALTSTQMGIRMMGRNWSRLHRLIYLIAVLGLFHFWWMTKPGVWKPWPETLTIGILLGYRLLLHLGLLARWDGYDGRESAERVSSAPLVDGISIQGRGSV